MLQRKVVIQTEPAATGSYLTNCLSSARHPPEAAKAKLAGESVRRTREQELRNFLGTFNFSGDKVTQKVGTMSGGEKPAIYKHPRADKLLKVLEREIQYNERQTAALKVEKLLCEQRLETTNNYPEIQYLADKLKEIDLQIEAKENQWLQLQVEVEQWCE